VHARVEALIAEHAERGRFHDDQSEVVADRIAGFVAG
jgi:hypothetical protein